jgi:type VI secretion system secreted protein VgrG
MLGGDATPPARVRVSTGPAGVRGGRVLDAHVREGINIQTAIDLTLQFDQGVPRWSDLKEQAVEIEMECGGARRPFWGVVVGLRSAGGTGQAAVWIKSALWLLSLRSTWRVFYAHSSVDVLRAVLPAGSCRVVDLLRQPPRRRDRITQVGETHLEFVLRLLAEDGINFLFRHDPGGEAMVLVDHNDSFDAIGGLSLHGVPRAPGIGGTTGLRAPRPWQVEHQCVPAQGTVADLDPTRPHLEVLGRAVAPGAAGGGGTGDDAEIYFALGGVVEPEHAQQVAQVRLEQLRCAETVLSGRGDDPRVAAGHRFTFHEAGGELAGEWLCVAAEHHAVEQGYGMGTPPYHSLFQCVPSAMPFRPAPRPAPKLPGDYSAFVVGADGRTTPDADKPVVANEHGHVRIRLAAEHPQPDAASGQPYPHDSGWVPLGSSWAGAGGVLRCPRVGESVTVRFLGGNPDRPFVSGAIPATADVPPHEVARHPLRTTWETRPAPDELKAYHMISFDDDKGRPSVVLHSGGEWHESVTGDQRITVGRDQHVDIVGARVERIAGGLERHVKGSEVAHVEGDVVTHTAGDRRDTCDKNYSVQAAQDVTIKCRRFIIDADYISLRGGGSLIVFSDKALALEGPPKVQINCGRASATAVAAEPQRAAPRDPLPAENGRQRQQR